jgi:hypothetical protein
MAGVFKRFQKKFQIFLFLKNLELKTKTVLFNKRTINKKSIINKRAISLKINKFEISCGFPG